MSDKVKKIKNVDELAVAAIRATCIDGINKSKSGHPGACLGIAPIMYELYKDFFVANPFQPKWINRDRLVLSAGHASMLLYTMLHLCSYDISIEDLQAFRQFGSKTPGHPEVDVVPGVDAGSGPLGQGIAQAVGLAMAETMLAAQYGSKLYNHYTYCICGDGCLEEGISQEAISFAGLQKLNKLILFYDSNHVTLDGDLANSSDEDAALRFKASHWNVIIVKDGNSLIQIKNAIKKAQASHDKPTVIICKTIIGFGSKNQGTSKVHGAPLGEEDGNNAKASYGYTAAPFEIPQEVYDRLKDTFLKRGEIAYQRYQEVITKVQESDPFLYRKIMDLSENDVSKYLNENHLAMNELSTESTRNTSMRVLNYFHELLPTIALGGRQVYVESANLEPEKLPGGPSLPEGYHPAEGTVTASENLNLRSGPGTEYEKVGKLPEGTSCRRIALGENGWSILIFEGKQVYAKSEYLLQIPTYRQVNETLWAKVQADYYTSPDTRLKPLGTLHVGDPVRRTGIGDNGWSRITQGGSTAYVESAALSPTDPSTGSPKKAASTVPFRYEYVHQEGLLDHALFTPLNTEKKSLPLIISLHGASEVRKPQSDFENKFLVKLFREWDQTGLQAPEAYIVCPHLSEASGLRCWHEPKSADELFQLIDHLLKTCPIDPSQIVLEGHSMGGQGALYMATDPRACFARVAVFSGYPMGRSCDSIKIPIRGYSGKPGNSGDYTVDEDPISYEFMKKLFERDLGIENWIQKPLSHDDLPVKVMLEDLDEDHKSDLLQWLLPES